MAHNSEQCLAWSRRYWTSICKQMERVSGVQPRSQSSLLGRVGENPRNEVEQHVPDWCEKLYKVAKNRNLRMSSQCNLSPIACRTDIHTNSPGYDTSLLVSHTGQQISQKETSCEIFCALIWNLSHFLPNVEFSLIHSSVSRAYFNLHIFYHWQRLFRRSIMRANCDGLYFMYDFVSSYNVLSHSYVINKGLDWSNRALRGVKGAGCWYSRGAGGGGGNAKERVSRF